jgi:flagellar hook-associated protein 2
VSYAAVPDSLADGGTLAITAGPAVADKFDVDLAAADADGDGTLTVRELAAAINRAPNNASLVSASVVTVDGVAQLVLTSKNTGVNYGVVVDATNVTNPGLKSALTPAGGPATLVAAQDAVVWLGAKDTGTKIQQATNTFTNVEGVKMTFTRAQAAGENPVTLTVAADTSGTTANVQAFIDAYNKLKGVIDGMVASGDPSKGVAGGPFAHDSGVKALQGRLVSMLRQAGATSLAAFGITATRQGALTLDATRLTKQLATDPTGLDKLIGSSSASASSGIAGSLDSYLKLWSGTTNGQLKQRKDATDKLQIDLTKRQGLLDGQYDRSYQRFLIQFTKLQSLQSQMSSNNSLFDALFGEKSK